MAKVGNRQGKTLVCQSCKEENYTTQKNVINIARDVKNIQLIKRKNSIDRGESNDKRKRYQKWINN